MKYKHFKMPEFQCPCCQKNITSHKLINMLDLAREIAGIPFVITSGYRCEKHNAEVGGKKKSSHLLGLACDIACKSDRDRFVMLDALKRAGFTRIGIGKDFIHVDIDTNKPDNLIWVY